MTSPEALLHRYQGLRVLVTGHTGFKGSWLGLWLHHLGAVVEGLALEPESPRDNFVVTGLENLCRHRVLDIRDRSAVAAVIAETQPDVIFHLAAQSLVLTGYSDPWRTFTTNATGTLNILDGIREWGGSPSVVIVTTDKVYEDRRWSWGYREVDRLGGRDPYSASKACAEMISESYRQSYLGSAMAVATARAGNVVGAGDWAENRIVPDVQRLLWDGTPLVLRHPQAVRPWQHVLEPIFGYLLLAVSGLDDPERFSGPWNFGPATSQERTVSDLVGALLGRAGSGSFTVDPEPADGAETEFLALDSTKARRGLGWLPALDFEATMDMVASGYEADRHGGDVLSHRLAQIEQFVASV
jgi:CDP-glucose 4,6-dehydratase